MKKTANKPRLALRLTESAMLIAIATVLSLVKLAELPYGGSVTIASMLPIIIIAYRYGSVWGFLCGLVHGAIQLVLGLNTLSYVTGWASVAAVIFLDYIIAFALIGATGFTRKLTKSQRAALVSACVIGSALRYLCHVVSGATVWAGLSIPTSAALKYSLVYNATYMLPETIVLLIAAFYIGSALDFGKDSIVPAKSEKSSSPACSLIAGAIGALAGLFAVSDIFGVMQKADDGSFDITGISNADWKYIVVVALFAIIVIMAKVLMQKSVKTGMTTGVSPVYSIASIAVFAECALLIFADYFNIVKAHVNGNVLVLNVGVSSVSRLILIVAAASVVAIALMSMRSAAENQGKR